MSDDYRLIQMQRQIEALIKALDELKTRESDNGWGAVLGRHLALPGLRGFWPINSYDQNGAVYDYSEQGRTLTNTAATAGVYGDRVGYLDFNGTTAFLARADEAGLDITANLTFGGWFRHDTVAANQFLLGKFNATGNQRSWCIQMLNGAPDVWRTIISTDGAASVVATHTATVDTGVWHHIVAEYTASTELAIWVDGVKVANTTGIPASLFNSSADFRIAAAGGAPLEYLDGRAALCFLCAAALPDTLIQELFAATRRFFV